MHFLGVGKNKNEGLNAETQSARSKDLRKIKEKERKTHVPACGR
jgi:hypothetical protein